MADGVKLYKDPESNNEEEKTSPISYNYQLTEALEDSVMLDNEIDAQKLNSSDMCQEEGHPKELSEVSNFCYDRASNASIVKRTRGRPRKDCQRPTKHHLGQSMATKV